MDYEFVRCMEGENPGYRFRLFANQGETINLNAASLRTKDREAVEVSLPNSMHAGQIMLTKMLTATDLRFYEFEGDVPMRRWYF